MNDFVATTTTAESDVSFITEMMRETKETRKQQEPEDGIPKLVDKKGGSWKEIFQLLTKTSC